MYNIDELNEMDDVQLRELAKSMGIKRVDTADHQDLVYQVLDLQAETDAQAASAQEQPKRRRERIRQPAAKANGNEVTKDDAVPNKKNKDNKKSKESKAEQPAVEQPAIAAVVAEPVAE